MSLLVCDNAKVKHVGGRRLLKKEYDLFEKERKGIGKGTVFLSVSRMTKHGFMETAYSLQRFLDAQAKDYEIALTEIKQGRKRSHWMWYIFPQIQGLGFSSTSQYYALKDLQEARAYLEHPVLGSRLIRICEVLIALPTHDAHQVFGSPDDMKLKSSMTLFAALNSHPVFEKVITHFYKGEKDQKTLQLL